MDSACDAPNCFLAQSQSEQIKIAFLPLTAQYSNLCLRQHKHHCTTLFAATNSNFAFVELFPPHSVEQDRCVWSCHITFLWISLMRFHWFVRPISRSDETCRQVASESLKALEFFVLKSWTVFSFQWDSMIETPNFRVWHHIAWHKHTLYVPTSGHLTRNMVAFWPSTAHNHFKSLRFVQSFLIDCLKSSPFCLKLRQLLLVVGSVLAYVIDFAWRMTCCWS